MHFIDEEMLTRGGMPGSQPRELKHETKKTVEGGGGTGGNVYTKFQ